MAATYALKSVVDQLALDVAARQTAADVDQRVATALLSYLTQTAYQAGQALQDARLDGHDADILALQNGGPFATGAELTALQVSLQSAIDGILAVWRRSPPWEAPPILSTPPPGRARSPGTCWYGPPL